MNVEQRLTKRLQETPVEMWTMPVPLEASLVTWITVHGYLLLALRHPGIAHTYTAAYAEKFVRDIEKLLVESGALNPEDVADIHEVERLARIEAERNL